MLSFGKNNANEALLVAIFCTSKVIENQEHELWAAP